MTTECGLANKGFFNVKCFPVREMSIIDTKMKYS